MIAAMKNLAISCVLFAAVSLLGGCAQQKDSAPTGLLCNVCVVSGEELPADAPTAAYGAGKVGFCCDKCEAKFAKLDDTGKKAAFEKAMARK